MSIYSHFYAFLLCDVAGNLAKSREFIVNAWGLKRFVQFPRLFHECQSTVIRPFTVELSRDYKTPKTNNFFFANVCAEIRGILVYNLHNSSLAQSSRVTNNIFMRIDLRFKVVEMGKNVELEQVNETKVGGRRKSRPDTDMTMTAFLLSRFSQMITGFSALKAKLCFWQQNVSGVPLLMITRNEA